MKKIYSVLLMMLVSGVTFAQTLFVSVNGEIVSDGQILECRYDEIEEKPLPFLTIYKMEPEVIIKSTKEQYVTVSIDVLEKKGDDQIQNCFVSCITANSSNNFYVEESALMTKEQEKNAQIHFNTKVNPNECPLSRNVLVKVSTDTESLTFTIHMFWDPDGVLSVNNIQSYDKSDCVYNIWGSRVSENDVPSGKIIIRNGKKMIK